MYSKTALAGKAAIITGASRGIGLATAQAFAAAGARKLTLIGRNRESLLEARSAIIEAQIAGRGGEGGKSVEVEVQVGDVGERRFWEEEVLKGKGKEKEEKDDDVADILVNAAGTSHASLFATTSAAQIEAVMRTNLMGTTWGCQSTVKAMLRRNRRTRRRGTSDGETNSDSNSNLSSSSGCIINVASLLGVKGGRGSVAYAASKAGVLGLTRSLAAEVGQAHIRVNAIVPGYVTTFMTDGMATESRVSAVESIPMKRFGHPDEIASAAVFLAVNEYANNCVINLDGGLSAT